MTDPHNTSPRLPTPPVAPAPPTPHTLQHPHHFIRQATLVAGFTFISRLLGLVRDTVLAACFGLTVLTDAFWIAFIIPNLLRRLFGEGALTAAFIPAYTDLRRSDPQQARRLAWGCIALSAAVLVTLALAGELMFATLLYTRDWPEHHAATLKLTAIMLPYMPMICLVALLAAVLQVHGRFGPPAAAPIILNLTMIATALVASRVAAPTTAIELLALGVLVAGIAQLAWQFTAARKVEPFTRHHPLRGAWPLVRPVLWATVPTAAALAVFQVNALLDSLIAFTLSPKTPDATHAQVFGVTVRLPIRAGSVTALQFAQRLYQFPLGVFGIALATAIFPALARANTHKNQDPDAYRVILQKGLRLAVFIGLPATVGLLLVRTPLVRTIFEYKQFGPDDSRAVASILAGYASAVWAYILVHLLTRAFYAQKDTHTPLKIAMCMVVLNLGLNLTLVWPLGAPALAWSTAAAAAVQAMILLAVIRRRTQGLIDLSLLSSAARSGILTAVMAGALTAVNLMLRSVQLPRQAVPLQLLGMVGLGATIILLGARLLRMPELWWLMRRSSGDKP